MSLQTEMQTTLLTLTSAASAKNMSESDYLDLQFFLIEGGGATTAVDAIITAATGASLSLAATELTARKTAAVAVAAGSTAAAAALPSASFTAAAVTGKLLTGYVSGAGTVAATDTILQGVNKLNGNVAGKATKPTGITAVGSQTPAVDQSTTNTNIAALQAKLDALIAALNA
jgi:hypothetical protein